MSIKYNLQFSATIRDVDAPLAETAPERIAKLIRNVVDVQIILVHIVELWMFYRPYEERKHDLSQFFGLGLALLFIDIVYLGWACHLHLDYAVGMALYQTDSNLVFVSSSVSRKWCICLQLFALSAGLVVDRKEAFSRREKACTLARTRTGDLLLRRFTD